MTRFSLYTDPLSSETKNLRRNSVIASTVALFIGISRELPSSLSLLGMSFTSPQQQAVGWFIFAAVAYSLLHFFASAAVEVATWARPALEWRFEKEKLLEHPAYDETSFIDMDEPVDIHNLDEVRADAESHGAYQATRKLRVLNMQVYLRFFFELGMPLVVGVAGLCFLGYLLVVGSK